MKVLMSATSYPHDLEDWRGLFIRHLTYALARSGNIDLQIWAPPGELPANVQSMSTQQESAWLGNLMQQGGIAHLIRQRKLSAVITPIHLLRYLSRAYRDASVDIYHVNWLQCALALPNNRVPALITVLGNDMKLLRLPLMKAALRRVLKHRRAMICPNAEWMMQPLNDAFGDLAQITPINFGIDASWYELERHCDGNQPAKWIAVTRMTRDKLGPLFEWSEAPFGKSTRELHVFGPMQEPIALPNWVHYHGPASPAALQSTWFPAATGLITLSRHAEGRPQVMLEALASGLPIVASSTPAHEGIVQDGETGMLCDSPEQYAHALAIIDNPDHNRRIGRAARSWAKAEIGTWDDCAQRFCHAYLTLTGATGFE